MSWVAELLNRTLRPWEKPPPLFLQVISGRGALVDARWRWVFTRPGLLTVYHAFRPWPYYRFLAVASPAFFQWRRSFDRGSPFRVAPTDLSCRIDAQGSARLQITPAGSRFQFTLHCDDGTALQEALACF
jgi:hypothetical protein